MVAFFDDPAVTAADLLKSLAVVDDAGRPVLVLLAGDREARLPAGWRLFEDDDFAAHPSLVKGYIGPMGQQAAGITVVADRGVARPGPWVTGANRADHHVSGALLGPGLHRRRVGLVRRGGDRRRLPPVRRRGRPGAVGRGGPHVPAGGEVLDVMPGASFVAEDGTEAVFSMGCYGMGVSRLLAVLAEEHHDDRGLVWPAELAPFQVHLAALGAGRAPEVAEAADALYGRLVAAGVDVLYDDRDVSPGVKFADADLLGIPVRLVVGAKGVARGIVEWRSRATGEEREADLSAPVEALLGA